MAGLPPNFQSISAVLPTYQFIDIISGTGYITFYAGKTVDLNLLSNFTYYSDTFVLSAAAPDLAYTKVIDVDFDVLLNRPIDLQGNAIVNVPVAIYRTGVGTVYFKIIAKIRKWDGVTETDIISNESSANSNAGVPTLYYMKAVDLVVPLTHFKKGEYLRLTIEGWGYRDPVGTGDPTVYIAYDPKGRTTGWDTTGAVPSTLIFQCPVRLNL